MMTASNALSPPVFVSSLGMPLEWTTSAKIEFDINEPVGTPAFGQLSSLKVLSLLRDSKVVDWRLKATILVQIENTVRESIATTWLEGVAEYGTGRDEAEAIEDLVISLGEYSESLAKRKKNLGDSALRELDCLQKLINRSRSKHV